MNTKSEMIFNRALKISEKRLRKNNDKVVPILLGITALYTKQKRYEEAEPLVNRALSILKNDINLSNPRLAAMLTIKARICEYNHEYKEVERIYERIFSMTEKTYGKKHPEYGVVLRNFAVFHMNRGNYQKAKTMLNDSIIILKNALGLENYNTKLALKILMMLTERMKK